MRIIGVNTWVWTSPLDDASLKTIARRAAAMGFTGLELPVENVGDWDPLRARDVLQELGLTPFVVGAMAPGRDLVAAPQARVEATQRYLAECVRVAQVVGARVVAGPFTASTGRVWRMDAAERAEAVAQLRANLAPVVSAAHDAGVAIGIEPLNRYETSLLNTVEQALDALDPLLGPSLGLALDSYHLNIEEKNIALAVRSAAGHIAHVQVCGTDRGAAGDDHFAWGEFFDALQAAGYDGALTVESFTADNDTIATAASVWRPLAESQDALAERSLAFLTRTLASRGEA